MSSNKIDSNTYIFKIIILGDPGVGKTSLLRRYTENVFEENYIKTIGCDFLVKTVNFDFGNIIMNIWDIAGDEKFKFLIPIYLKDADACIFVFDVTKKLSLIHINDWKELFFTSKNKPFIILCNKIDLINNMKDAISKKEVKKEIKEEIKNNFFYTSAKTGENVEESFKLIGKMIYNKALKQLV